MGNTSVWILYTNHRGEARWRQIIPREMFFGASDWHPEPQWQLAAHDVERLAMRTFAMTSIHVWRTAPPERQS
jgi:predicted DNA-binding transcriptional regulator YafY